MKNCLAFASLAVLLAAGASPVAPDDRDKPPAPTTRLGPPTPPPGTDAAPPGLQPPGGFPGQRGFRPGGTDYKHLIPVLLEPLTDEDADVRQHVVHTLARIGQPAVAPLLDILKEKDG